MRYLLLARRAAKAASEAGIWKLNAMLARVCRPEVVFLGDSITRFWLPADPGLFWPRRENLGVSGNTTAAMLESFRLHEAAHRPKIVHIMGGTNDLWYGAPGPDASATVANLTAIVERCRALGICPILASPPPISPEAKPLFANAALFPTLRSHLEHYCRSAGVLHVDYQKSLADEEGVLRRSFTTDGVHLTRRGYAAMRSQAEQVIEVALQGSF